MNTRYEEYINFKKGLPFVLNCDIKRTSLIYSKEQNWHEDLEIQFCEEGKGTVILNGKRYIFSKGEIAVANSNVIHYTGTENNILYTCLIISAEYCRIMGIDCQKLEFSPCFKNEKLFCYLEELKALNKEYDIPCKIARLNEILLKILIELTINHSKRNNLPEMNNKKFESIKSAIKYIRENFSRKISLQDISKAVYTDKYTLCREFKKITGQTVVEYINNYRCRKAAEYIAEGCTVTESARACGFENISFFTKTFKKYMGVLPSIYKNI